MGINYFPSTGGGHSRGRILSGSLFPLGNCFLGFFPLLHGVSVSWTPTPLQAPLWALGPHHSPVLSSPQQNLVVRLLMSPSRRPPQFSARASPWMARWVWLFRCCPVRAPWHHLSGPYKCPSTGGPQVNLPAWQHAEQCAFASSRCPMAPVVPRRAQSPQQREGMTWSLSTGSAGSELTRRRPDCNSCFLGFFRASIP